MSLGILWGSVVSAALVAGVSLVSILQVGDWARASTPAGCYFFQYISWPQIGIKIQCSMLYWALMSSQLVGKCHTLTFIKFCEYVGLSGHSYPHYWANSYPIVCTVLALDSCKYCWGEQGPAVQHHLLTVWTKWLHWIRGGVPPCGKGRYHKVAAPYFLFHYLHWFSL